MPIDRALMAASKAWPFAEARNVVARLEKRPPEKGFALFQTGYGPSGLPHIGTFAEVFRTSLVRHAFGKLTDMPSALYAFSDDMDGLRKVPDNLPNQEMLRERLGQPLTAIPDPFGTHESFGHHMNARLQAFLDRFGFDYDFKSSTACYRAGLFDQKLRRVLARHEAIRAIVAPELGEERRATYSPILPVSPKTGRVLQVPMKELRPDQGAVVFEDEDGSLQEVPVTGGHCKLQWRADWALRWAAFDVDYEMSGKDLIDSVRLGSAICREIGGRPPIGLTFELFLDAEGRKISKSKGNGLSIEEWLTYGDERSLAYFLYQSPKKAKRLHFDVIPKTVDDYAGALETYRAMEEGDKRLGSAIWHMHEGDPPAIDQPLTYAMLLNLASVVNAEEPAALWAFVNRYAPDATPDNAPELAARVERALAYYRDFVKPAKRYRAPDPRERAALEELRAALEAAPADIDAASLQNEIYEIGKRAGFDNLRNWFQALYEILLGQSQGPRMGSFVHAFGVEAATLLIARALRGELATEEAA